MVIITLLYFEISTSPVGNVHLSLIHLRARLIETLFNIVQIENDIIGGGLADDTNDLGLSLLGKPFPYCS